MKHLKSTSPVVSFLLLSFVVAAFAEGLHAPPAPETRLGIEIDLKKPFYIPAATQGRGIAAFIRIPGRGGSQSQPEQISAIKLAPKMVGDKIEVAVSAVYGDTTDIKECKDWDVLRQSPIASYVLREGERVAISELTNLGADFKNKTLTFKVVPVKAAPNAQDVPASGCECGWCGGLACCPNPGFCLTCGSCGTVCCAPSGGN